MTTTYYLSTRIPGTDGRGFVGPLESIPKAAEIYITVLKEREKQHPELAGADMVMRLHAEENGKRRNPDATELAAFAAIVEQGAGGDQMRFEPADD